MIRKHQFDLTPDNEYVCRHCKRISNDPDIIRDLPCVDREGDTTDDFWDKVFPAQNFRQITAEHKYWTQAVADETLAHVRISDVHRRMENEMKMQVYADGKVPARIKLADKPVPMTSMPGYSVFRMDVDVVPARKVEIERTMSVPMVGYTEYDFADVLIVEYLQVNDERRVGPDPEIRSWGEGNELVIKVVFWTLPARTRVVAEDGTLLT